MARTQDNAHKATISILLAVAIIAGSIHSAAAACANALPAAASTYCSGLSAVVPSGATISPCNADPGCGSVRQLSTNTAICVPLDSYCCVQTDCFAASTGGSCKNGTTLACGAATPGSIAPTTAPTTVTGGTIPTVTGTTPTSVVPTSVGAGSANITTTSIVNTTSKTVTVCYTMPLTATVV